MRLNARGQAVELVYQLTSSRFGLHFYLQATGVIIMPSYGNTQLAGNSSIVKLPYKLVPIHNYLQLFEY